MTEDFSKIDITTLPDLDYAEVYMNGSCVNPYEATVLLRRLGEARSDYLNLIGRIAGLGAPTPREEQQAVMEWIVTLERRVSRISASNFYASEAIIHSPPPGDGERSDANYPAYGCYKRMRSDLGDRPQSCKR